MEPTPTQPQASTTNSPRRFSGYKPTWCSGCGDFGIHIALQKSLANQGLDPSSVLATFGIGCSGNMNDFLNVYAMHGLHGRGIPNAIGMKIANHAMPVIDIAGDGDTYGEGGNHFLHACRGNHDITVLIHDNGVYGLTTGQASSTAARGFKSKSTPKGAIDAPLNPLVLAISQGATFVAQGYSMDPKLHELITLAMQHKGFSLVNILQPCATFNKINTPQYYKEHSYQLEASNDQRSAISPDADVKEVAPTNSQPPTTNRLHDPADKKAAILKAMENTEDDKFPLGIIYKEDRPAYHEQLAQLEQSTLIKRERFTDFGKLAKAFV